MGAIERFGDQGRTLDDPRMERCQLPPLPEIFLATWAGVMGNAEGGQDLEDLATAKRAVLREYLPYVNGVPRDDTRRRFFRALDPKQFQEWFMAWVRRLRARPEARA
jgi:DDE_Tnp_1-associated